MITAPHHRHDKKGVKIITYKRMVKPTIKPAVKPKTQTVTLRAGVTLIEIKSTPGQSYTIQHARGKVKVAALKVPKEFVIGVDKLL